MIDISLAEEKYRDRYRDMRIRPNAGVALNIILVNELRFSSINTEYQALFLIRSGEMRAQCGHMEWSAKEGEFMAIAAGKSFNITNVPSPKTGTYQSHGLLLDYSVLRSFYDNKPCPATLLDVHVISEVETEMIASFEHAYATAKSDNDLPAAVARHRTTEVLVWLAAKGVYFDPAEKTTLVARVQRLLSTELERKWTEHEVAKRIGMSPASMRRHLAAEKTCFRDVLGNARMQRALRLLQSSDLPISRVASDVGYDCPSRFSARFRSRFGFQPSVVRGHNRGVGA